MSRTVDERAVVMEFDNKQFESGIQQSTKSLEAFDKKLQLKNATDGIDKISKALEKVDFMGIQSSLQTIEDRFNTFGIIGKTVIENLTNSAINFAKNGLGKILGQITEGGKKRAMNIESARFLLQGLLDDEKKVEDVMSRAMTSVEGTAFGFDEAAKAASNFVASGVEAEKLDKYLKSTANLASATGAEYQAVSDLMGKIAGQGRIMGDELRQFSAMGINAAQYIAEYLTNVNNGKLEIDKALREEIKQSGLLVKNLEVTQQMVRDAITDKDTNILPDVVVEGLNKKLKEIAKRANETFTGAISNVKAAMSRMGAMFYSPLVAQNSDVIKLINAIRIAFNGLNKGIEPLAKNVTDIVLGISKFLSFIAEGIGTDNEKSLLATKDLMLGISNILQPYLVIIKTVIEKTNELFGKNWVRRLNASIFAFSKWIENGHISITVTDIFKGKIEALIKSFEKAIQPIREFTNRLRDAFYKVFNLDDTRKNLLTFITTLTKFFDSFGGFDPNKATGMKELIAFFEAVKSIGSSVGSVIKTIFDALLTVFDIKDTQGIITGITSSISDMAVRIADFLSIDSTGLDKLKTILVDLFSAIKDIFGVKDTADGGITDFIFGLLNSIKDSGILYSTLELLVSIFIALKEAVKSLIDSIFDFLDALGIINSDVDNSTPTLEKVSDFIHNLSEKIRGLRLPSFDGFIDFIKSIAENVKKFDFKGFFGDLGDAIKDLFSKSPNEDNVNKFKKLLDVLLKGLAVFGGIKVVHIISTIHELFNGATMLNGIFALFGKAGERIKGLVKVGSVAETVKEFGKVLIMFAAALYIISKIPENDIDRSITYLGLAFGAIIALMDLMLVLSKKMTGSKAAMIVLQRTMTKFSTALILISISLWIAAKAMSGVEDITNIMTIYELVIGGMILMMLLMSNLSTKVNTSGLKALRKIMSDFSTSLWFISMSIKTIAEVVAIDPSGTVIKTFEIILISLATVVTIMGLVSNKVNPTKVTKFTKLMVAVGAAMIATGAAMILMAAALYILSTINTDNLWDKVTMIVVILAALSTASLIMSKIGIGSSVGMLTMATSIAIMAGGLQLFNDVDWGSVLKALAAISGVAAVMGVFSAVVGPAAAALVPVAGAFAIFAGGVLLLSAAALLMANAVGAFALSLIALDEAIVVVGKNSSKLGTFFGEMVASVTEAIGKSQEKINDTINSLVANIAGSFINSFITMGGSIAINMGEVWQNIMNSFTGMGGTDKDTGEKMANATFGDFAEKLKEIFSPQNVSAIKESASNFLGGMLDGAYDLLPKIEKIFDEFLLYASTAGPKFIGGLLSGFGDVLGQLGSDLANTDGGWTTTFEVLFGDVIDATDRLINAKAPIIMDTVLNLLSQLVNKVQAWTEVNFPVMLDTFFFMLGAFVTKLAEWTYANLPTINELILFILGAILDTTLTFLATAFDKLLVWWNDNWPTIAEFLYTTFMDTLELAAKALIDSTELITKTAVELGFAVMIGFLDGIAEKLPDITESAINLIETFRDEVCTEENTERVVDAGVGIVENFVNGIADWLEDENNIISFRDSFTHLGEAALKAIKTFFGIGDSGEAGSGSNLFSLAWNILKGLADGIKNAWETSPLKHTIDWLCDKFKGEMESKDKGFDVNSPSKWAKRLGVGIDEGLAIGVKDGSKQVLKSVDSVTENTKDAFSILMDSLRLAGDENFDINPVITPIVDTSNIEDAAAMASSAFSGANGSFNMSYGLSSALAAEFAQNGGVNTSNSSSNNSIVNFTQNNYSPKALSHYEVYRQTKNLLHTIDSRK